MQELFNEDEQNKVIYNSKKEIVKDEDDSGVIVMRKNKAIEMEWVTVKEQQHWR